VAHWNSLEEWKEET